MEVIFRYIGSMVLASIQSSKLKFAPMAAEGKRVSGPGRRICTVHEHTVYVDTVIKANIA